MGVKRTDLVAVYFTASVAKVKNAWSYSSTYLKSSCLHVYQAICITKVVGLARTADGRAAAFFAMIHSVDRGFYLIFIF